MDKKIYDINIYIDSACHTKKIKKLRKLSPQMFANYQTFLMNSQNCIGEYYTGIDLGDWKDNHFIHVGDKYILKYNTYIAYNPNTLSKYTNKPIGLLNHIDINGLKFSTFFLAVRYLRHEYNTKEFDRK